MTIDFVEDIDSGDLPNEVDRILDLYEELMDQGKTEDEAVAAISEQFPDHMELLRALIPPIAGEGESFNPQDGIS